jgi:hypothetical protein
MLFSAGFLIFGLTGPQTIEAPSIMPLQRQLSAPASTAMRRRRSSKTNSGSGPGTSRPKQSSSRPINIPAPRSSQPWPTHEEGYPAYTSHSLPVHHHARPVYRPSLGVFQDLSPQDYLSHSPDEYQMPGLSLTPSPTVARGESHPQDLSRLSVSTAPGCVWDAYPSSGSVSESGLTNASTATSEPMSRTTTNEMLIEPLQMCRVSSQVSRCGVPETPTTTNDFSSFEESFFPESFDSGVLNILSDASFASFSPSHSLPQSFIPSSLDMQHSPSQESIDSSSSSDSSQSRHLRRVQEQNVQSKRPLAPKSQSQNTVLAMPTAKIVEIVAEDGTRQKKAQISRFSRQPKETTKVSCFICNDHKEGFHGEHELRRHIDRTHKGFRKVFICKDISPDGTFLANCKHCRNMKTYGANYNAAAHLRRVHFNPCETPKGGRGKVSQNRGGIGGGDQPPMDVLRNWMYETWETNLTGRLIDDPSVMNTAYNTSNRLSSSDSGLSQSNDAVQISDADLDFVQQTTQLDMSFLRYSASGAFNMALQSSPISNGFFTPSQHDLPFFDADLTN